MKHGSYLISLLAAAVLLSTTAIAAPDLASVAGIKRAVDLPPSADLAYTIKARQKGFALAGDALVTWRVTGGKYSLRSDTRAALFGSLIDDRSDGAIDSFGLAPAQFSEKRVRHDPWTTTFDRSSVVFQLAGVARAAPDKFVAGSEWTFFVAGRRDADVWTFRVIKPETVQTGFGAVDAVHLIRLPPPDSREQALDVWLAPSKEWFPARIKFTDSDDEFVDQTLQSVTRK